MKKRKGFSIAVTIGSSCVLAGCINVYVPGEQTQPSSQMTSSSTLVSVQMPSPESKPKADVCGTVATNAAPVAEKSTAFLVRTVAVKATAGNQESNNLTESLVRKLREECIRRGFEVQEGTTADATISLTVTRFTSNQLGEHRIYEGTATVCVRASNGKLLGETEFRSNCRRPALTEWKAEEPVCDFLSERMTDWMKQVLINKETKENTK